MYQSDNTREQECAMCVVFGRSWPHTQNAHTTTYTLETACVHRQIVYIYRSGCIIIIYGEYRQRAAARQRESDRIKTTQSESEHPIFLHVRLLLDVSNEIQSIFFENYAHIQYRIDIDLLTCKDIKKEEREREKKKRQTALRHTPKWYV